jgi:hypothetical protein
MRPVSFDVREDARQNIVTDWILRVCREFHALASEIEQMIDVESLLQGVLDLIESGHSSHPLCERWSSRSVRDRQHSASGPNYFVDGLLRTYSLRT